MAARRNNRGGIIASGGILFLLLAIIPASAGEIEDRIRKLEAQQRVDAEELARLKGEQLELKKQATEAAAALPTFTFRRGSGVFIEAADKSWGLRFRGRMHYRLLTWPDDQAVAANGFSQADIALRRLRPRINYFWDNRFYELDIEWDFSPDRTMQIQHGELHVNFPQLNPFLPVLVIGLGYRVSLTGTTPIGAAPREVSSTVPCSRTEPVSALARKTTRQAFSGTTCR